MKHCRSHSNAHLRVCSQPPYPAWEWRHPGEKFSGKLLPQRGWRDMPCWLNSDIDAAMKKFNAPMFKRVELKAELDWLMEKAARGELAQEDPHSYWKRGRGEALRTALDDDVCCLRLSEPFYIRQERCRVRVFYCEPDSVDILVSLGGLVKNVDDTHSKDKQNARIGECAVRGDDWYVRELDS